MEVHFRQSPRGASRVLVSSGDSDLESFACYEDRFSEDDFWYETEKIQSNRNLYLYILDRIG